MFGTLLGSKLVKESGKNGRKRAFFGLSEAWKWSKIALKWIKNGTNWLGMDLGCFGSFKKVEIWPLGAQKWTRKWKKRTKTGVFWSFWGLEMVQICFQMDRKDLNSIQGTFIQLTDYNLAYLSDIDSLLNCFYWNYFVRDSNNHGKAKAKRQKQNNLQAKNHECKQKHSIDFHENIQSETFHRFKWKHTIGTVHRDITCNYYLYGTVP